MSAELEARRTAAAAVAGDFRRATDAYIDADGPQPDYNGWAWRLYTELLVLLDQLGRETKDAEPGQLAAIRGVFEVFDWETDDRQYALEAIEQILTGDL
jgi:hypothetical protein